MAVEEGNGGWRCYNTHMVLPSDKIKTRFVIFIASVGAIAICFFLWPSPARTVRADDASAPVISNITFASTTASSTIVSWTTNKLTDSLVNFALDNQYNTLHDLNTSAKTHSVAIPNLAPGTTYYVRILATDAAGNQSISGDYTMTTPGSTNAATQNIANVSQKSTTDQILKLLDQIKDPAALQAILDKLQSVSSAALSPPKILGDPKLDVGTDQVTFYWVTDRESNSMVSYAADSDYQPSAAKPYTESVGSADEQVQNHVVTITGLTPATVYHYQLYSKGVLGDAATSADTAFTTKALLAQVVNARISKIEEHAVTLTWSTTYPASGVVEYTNMITRKKKSNGDENAVVAHTMHIEGLDFKTPYEVVVKAVNSSGDETVSTPLTFITTKNEIPPVISHVANESTLYADVDSKVQTIITWDTDEPSFCQLSYNEGGAKGTDNSQSTPEETDAGTHHTQVITSFLPATVYDFWITCKNLNGYDDRSEDFVLFTPQKEKNIIDLILQNFQGTFGWLGNVSGAKK
jgi:hypothetical protein